MGTKRKTLSLLEKQNIIHEVEANPHVSRMKMANRLGLAPSSLSTIMIAKDKIMATACVSGSQLKKRKNMKTGTNEELEKILLEWFLQARSNNVPIDGTILREKANQVACRLNIENFRASNGWLHRFKDRHDISFRSISGESKGVSDDAVDSWLNEKLPGLIADYELRNIFNADESALFYNLLPEKTLHMKREPCHGGKKSKERLSVLLCTNADGNEKLKPLVIGKFAKPRCFKGMKTFPCQYVNNSNAWMTSSIFLTFLKQLDAKMGARNRKILLFIDKCSSHSVDTSFLKNVKVFFFPENCTSKLQPLDLGIIYSMKRKYRKSLVQKALAAIDGKNQLKLNVLQAMHLLSAAWNAVTEETIRNCFKKAGFQPDSMTQEDGEDEEDVCNEEWSQLVQNKEIRFEDFVQCDNNIATTSTLSVDELCNSASTKKDYEEEDDDEIALPPPSFGEAMSSFDVIERYISSFNVDDSVIQRLGQLGRDLLFLKKKCKSKQTTLKDYFKKQ